MHDPRTPETVVSPKKKQRKANDKFAMFRGGIPGKSAFNSAWSTTKVSHYHQNGFKKPFNSAVCPPKPKGAPTTPPPGLGANSVKTAPKTMGESPWTEVVYRGKRNKP